MYLIHLPAETAIVEHWIFFDEDPRVHGCRYAVTEGVDFEDLVGDAGRGRSSTTKMPVLARHERRPSYRLFSCRLAAPLDFVLLSGFAFHFPTWADFMTSPVAKDDQWQPLVAPAPSSNSSSGSSICLSIRPEGLWLESGDALRPHPTSRLYGRWLNDTDFQTDQGAVIVCPPAGPSGCREGRVAWRDAPASAPTTAAKRKTRFPGSSVC